MNFEALYEKFNHVKQHGIVCPLFFLQTESSSLIGEYPDLIKIADFAQKCGFSIIQLLPIFDTGPEASPYSARSCYALNPVYLSLKRLPNIDRQDPELSSIYQNKETCFFDYYKIYTQKMGFLKKYISNIANDLQSSEEFSIFCDINTWLEDYACFCVYHDKTEIPPESWDIDRSEIISSYPDEVFFHKAVQFFCFQQMREAKAYIDKLGLSLMGDIPILLSPDSVEMWTHRSLFDFQMTVGAPPDQFTSEGQSWGFPMIRFVAKPQACASFWKNRIENLSKYFQLYRIDHAVGFFRLWVIPKGKKAKQGFFFPASDETALSNAKSLFDQLFKNSPMVPIAEDLGVIPEYVKNFILNSKLCGTKVLRWERAWQTDGRFIPVQDYPHYSMTTVSTHDTTFLFDDWNQDKDGATKLAQLLKIPYQKIYSKEIHEHILKYVHQSSSLFIINMLHEYLYLHDDFKNKLFRINDPGLATEKNWSSRMILPIEKLIADEQFCLSIKRIIQTV
jgi:4-alpha-glucanotransferase